MYFLKQDRLIPRSLRDAVALAVAECVVKRERSMKPGDLAAAVLLITAILKRETSIIELRQFEKALELHSLIEEAMLNTYMLVFDYVEEVKEKLSDHDPYLLDLRDTYNFEFIETVRKRRPDGIGHSHSLMSLVYDLITEELVPAP